MPNAVSSWLFVHLVAFAMLGAGVVLGSMLSSAGRRTTSVASHVVFSQLLKRVPALSGLGGILLVISGIALAETEGFSLGAPWISAAFTGWIVAVALAVGLSRPFARAVSTATDAAVQRGENESEAVRALYNAPRAKLAARGHEIVFLLLLLDMVFKPGA